MKKGEITVFLSLTLVCILSLLWDFWNRPGRRSQTVPYNGRQFSHGLCYEPV